MKFLRNFVFFGLAVGFFITAPRSKVVAQQSVTCKGFRFTEGVVIGNDNGNVITKILNKRVYVERNGALADNLGIYYAMKPAQYSSLNQDQWWGCVNPRDPSVNGSNMLGDQVGDAIPCNGKLITKDRWLNFYRGDDNFRTFNVAKIDKGVLRIHALRKDPNTTPSQAELNLTYADGARFNIGLLEAGWYNTGHSNDNPNEPTLSKAEIDGCIYKDDVKFADCVSNPVIGTISSVSQTGLSFSFSGFTGGIFTKIAWRIIPNVANKANERSGQINSPSPSGTNFSFASLPAGTYTLEIEGGDCNSSVNTKTFVIPSSTNSCSQNPVIGNITPVTQTGLTFSFTGSGIPNLTWRVKPVVANVNNERSGKTGSVNNAGVNLTFASLPYGEYNLEIEGGDCSSSTNRKSFIISKPNCATAPTVSGVSNITATGLTINFSGNNSANSVNWAIKNGSQSVVANGTQTTNGASSTNITYSFLANATYTLEVSGADCNSGTSSSQFSVNVERQACGSGPDIFVRPDKTPAIYDVSNRALTFLFDGSGVGSIAWRILRADGSSAGAGSELVPVHNHPTVSYNLPDGVYRLEIQGGSTCRSTPSVETFAINVPLPIYISDFKGETKKEGVNLSWNVVSEKNGEGFQVLRYDDEVKTPKIIANIPLSESKTGKYSFLDENPADGNNYYQLKQIDLDGSFTLSRIISVAFEQIYEMVLSPNPAKDFIDLNFESRSNGNATFETYTISGTRVSNTRQKVKVGNNRIHLNVSPLSEGNYILKIQNGSETKSMRFLKVR